MQRIAVHLVVAVVLLTAVSACSVVQATNGPEQKNLGVFEKGTERYLVLAEMGQPVVTDFDPHGHKFDIFKFRQGQHGVVKAGKAVAYGTAAVLTLGLSEIIASPLEGAAGNGAEIQTRVVYDESDHVQQVDILKDKRWLPVQDLGS